MKQQFLFRIERASSAPGRVRKTLFERIINTDSSIMPPYDTLSSSARFLYGNDVIITFEQTCYE